MTYEEAEDVASSYKIPTTSLFKSFKSYSLYHGFQVAADKFLHDISIPRGKDHIR